MGKGVPLVVIVAVVVVVAMVVAVVDAVAVVVTAAVTVVVVWAMESGREKSARQRAATERCREANMMIAVV